MKRKNVTITIISIMAILILGILVFFLFCNDMRKIKFVPNENSKYIPINDGSFLELSENGAITRYDYDGTAEKVLLESDIIEIVNGERKEDGNLIIHKDGTIGICKANNFDEEVIGKVKDAKTGVIGDLSIMILTEQGDVYEYYLPNKDMENLDDDKSENNFDKKKELCDIVDIECNFFFQAFLNKEGDVWLKGDFAGNTYNTYTMFDVDNHIKQMECTSHSIYVLDNLGLIYELGVSNYDMVSYSVWEEFKQISEYQNVQKIVAIGEHILLHDNDLNVFYFGGKNAGKASGVPIKGKLSIDGNIRNIYMRGEYIFLLTDKGMYIKKWDKL